MPVLRDYRCLAHGNFESKAAAPLCPHGCTTVEPVWLTPPSVHTGGRTRNIDRTLENLANDYGLSDLSNRSGSVAGSRSRSQPQGLQAGFRPFGEFGAYASQLQAEGAGSAMAQGEPAALYARSRSALHGNLPPMVVEAAGGPEDKAKLAAMIQAPPQQ